VDKIEHKIPILSDKVDSKNVKAIEEGINLLLEHDDLKQYHEGRPDLTINHVPLHTFSFRIVTPVRQSLRDPNKTHATIFHTPTQSYKSQYSDLEREMKEHELHSKIARMTANIFTHHKTGESREGDAFLPVLHTILRNPKYRLAAYMDTLASDSKDIRLPQREREEALNHWHRLELLKEDPDEIRKILEITQRPKYNNPNEEPYGIELGNGEFEHWPVTEY
jgi:hypothetical protein